MGKRSEQTTPKKKNWAKDLNRYLTKVVIRMANKYAKRCPASQVNRELQIKTTHLLEWLIPEIPTT